MNEIRFYPDVQREIVREVTITMPKPSVIYENHYTWSILDDYNPDDWIERVSDYELFNTREEAEIDLKRQLADIYSDKDIEEKVQELQKQVYFYNSLKEFRKEKE